MSDVDRPWDAAPKNPKKAPSEDKVGFAIKLAGVLALVLLVGWCSVETARNMEESDKNGDQSGAKRICQKYVKDQLKSPGTADFSTETATQDSGPDWTVTGVVDSQNSFGGTVRTGYRCEVTSTGDDTWRLRDLQTDGN